ncbi:MAG: helix-turn-helix domain-containing protein [Thermomicrobiales bacterium]
MDATQTERGPIVAVAEDHAALVALDRALANGSGEEDPVLQLRVGGETVELPESARQVLRRAVAALARDQAVAVLPYQKLLTTQQAADLLNVSRPYLVQLLEDGKIPFSKTGTHRRVHLDDLMAYKKRRDVERRRALERLVRMSEELGLYDNDDQFGPPRLADDQTDEGARSAVFSGQASGERAHHP